MIILDCESYSNYFMVGFKNTETQEIKSYELKGEDSYFDMFTRQEIKDLFHDNETIGFNSIKYDLMVLSLALGQGRVSEIKQLGDKIITEKSHPWMLFKENYGFIQMVYNRLLEKHIDIMNPTPGVGSLKSYGINLHAKKLQELPYHHSKTLTPDEMEQIRLYNENDLRVTELLYNDIKGRIDVRRNVVDEYGWSVTSMKDAKLAEHVICTKVQRLTGVKPKRPDVKNFIEDFKYVAPKDITFKTKECNELLNYLQSLTYRYDVKLVKKDVTEDSQESYGDEKYDFRYIEPNGNVLVSKEVKRTLTIGGKNYTIGVGGLHSTESNVWMSSCDEYTLIDKDVASFYPSIVLNNKYFPRGIGERFYDIYKSVLEERLVAKKNKDKAKNDVLKIVLNSTYGKFKERFSPLFDPTIALQVCLTGQLSLIMLLEELETNGISVVSANTDGFLAYVHRSQKALFETICSKWEQKLKYVLEDNIVHSIFVENVNNYIAIKEGGIYRKGCFAPTDVNHTPKASIIYDAICNYIQYGELIEDTITSCEDINKFISCGKSKFGIVLDNGSVVTNVRYYYSTEGKDLKNVRGEQVSSAQGVKLMMDLTKEIPDDLDYNWYISSAYEIFNGVSIF